MPASVLIITAYLLVGVLAFWPMALSHLFGVQVDYIQSVWFLDWVPHSLAHGLNPFFSDAIFVPTGANLAQNTSSPLLGLLAAALAMFGPVVRINLLMTLAMPLSATAAFMVLQKWEVWIAAAAVGGLVYGFSPYMVGQATGHIELTFLPLPPLIASALVSIAQQRGSPRRLGVQLGLLITAQYLVSPEVLTTVAILSTVALACVVVRRPELARAFVQPLALAAAVAAVLLSYPLWMMLDGAQHFAGRTWPTSNPFHNDLLSFVVPGPLQRVSLGMRSLGIRLIGAGIAAEAGGYIGVPVVVIAGYLAWQSRNRFRVKLAVVLLITSIVLSLGPQLFVDGRSTSIPLPFLLMTHVPFLDDVLPSRINLEVAGCLAAVIAFGLDDAHKRSHLMRPSSVILAAATLAVVAITQLPIWPPRGPYAPQPVVALPAGLCVPHGNPVTITYPYATFPDVQPMLWQAEDGFRFRILGGYAYRPTSEGSPTALPRIMNPSSLQQFLAGQEDAVGFGPPLPVNLKLVTSARATLERYDVRLIIVDRSTPGSTPVMELFTEALGPPQRSAGDFSMWAS
ncbi:MAG: hypothetical protein JO372_08910 [Solirubrobacterales bacterium]|nr:hypothetical protein [Solirubrobacterales bacterium]